MNSLLCPVCKLDLDTVDCVHLEWSWHPLMRQDIAVCPTCHSVLSLYEQTIDEPEERLCWTERDAYKHEEIYDIAHGLGVLPTEVVDIFGDARKLFSREAGCLDEQTDAIVWRVLRAANDIGTTATMIRAQIACLLHEELEMKRWFWLRWLDDIRVAHEAHARRMTELARGGQWA